MTEEWPKKNDRADGGSSVWLEHISAAWRIAPTRQGGKFIYSLWQRVPGKKYWRCFGVYGSADDAKSAHKFQSPNRISA